MLIALASLAIEMNSYIPSKSAAKFAIDAMQCDNLVRNGFMVNA